MISGKRSTRSRALCRYLYRARRLISATGHRRGQQVKPRQSKHVTKYNSNSSRPRPRLDIHWFYINVNLCSRSVVPKIGDLLLRWSRSLLAWESSWIMYFAIKPEHNLPLPRGGTSSNDFKRSIPTQVFAGMGNQLDYMYFVEEYKT